jgi:hypothetical protein
MAGQRLWAYEDTTLEQAHLRSFDTLLALVNGVLEAIVFESDLRVRARFRMWPIMFWTVQRLTIAVVVPSLRDTGALG